MAAQTTDTANRLAGSGDYSNTQYGVLGMWLLSDILVLNLAKQCPGPYDEILRGIGEVGVLWLILWYLYRNRTFLRA